MHPIISFVLGIVVSAPIFYFLGLHFERVEWNKLVQRGIIPKPFESAQ